MSHRTLPVTRLPSTLPNATSNPSTAHPEQSSRNNPDSGIVSDIVQPRPTGRRVRREAGTPDQRVKRVLHIAVQQPGARGGNEQRGSMLPGRRAVRSLEVLPDCSGGARVQGELAGFSELAMADGDQPLPGVEIVSIQRDGFADPHPGRDQQPDQGPVRRHPMRSAQRYATVAFSTAVTSSSV